MDVRGLVAVVEEALKEYMVGGVMVPEMEWETGHVSEHSGTIDIAVEDKTFRLTIVAVYGRKRETED